MKLKPVGSKLLVLPLEAKNYVTESKIELVESELSRAEIVEVSDELADIYKVGEVVLLPSKIGTLQIYNGKNCLWINGNGYPSGDVWAIVTEN
jgi:hypothetical protein